MEVYQGTADYIALCFASENRTSAEEILSRLNAARLRVWTSSRGCNVSKAVDAERLKSARTALILISEEWLAKDACTAQLTAAASYDCALVPVFLNGADLMQHESLRLLLSRSVRMLDYTPDTAEDFLSELLDLLCIQDCQMAEGEEPNTKKIGLFGFLR